MASKLSKAMDDMRGSSVAQYVKDIQEFENAAAWRSTLLEDFKRAVPDLRIPTFEEMFPDLKIDAVLQWQKELAAKESWQDFLKLSMGVTSTIADIAKSISVESLRPTAVNWSELVPAPANSGGAKVSSRPSPRTVDEIRRAIGEDELSSIRASLGEIREEQSRVAARLGKTDAKDPLWRTIAVQVLIALLIALVTEAVKLAFGHLETASEGSSAKPGDVITDSRSETMFAVSNGGATLFSGPATTQRTVALLACGDLVKVLRVKGRWVSVVAVASDNTLVVGWIKAGRIHSLTQALLDAEPNKDSDNAGDGRDSLIAL
jgi:hypothetical protein